MIPHHAYSRYLVIILLDIFLTCGLFGQLNATCETNSPTCVNGKCNSGMCVCDTCWTGETCNEWFHRIPKFTQNVFTFEMKLMNWINGSYIGRLHLDDENSSTALCGGVQFNIDPASDCLPIAVDLTTGIFRVNSCYGVINNSRPFTFQVTVTNSDTPSNISDKAVVNIFIDESYSNETTGSGASFDRRAITPPNNINITFSKAYTKGYPNYCLFDTWFVDSTFNLPPGNNSFIINVYGPSLNNVIYGYIEYLSAYYNGTNLASNYSIKFSDFTNVNNYSSPSKFSMTCQIGVSSTPANKKDDFSLKIRFKVGLFPEIPAPPVGTNLTFKLEALLTPKVTAELFMIVSSSCPVQYDAVNFSNCPKLVNIGGVYEYSVDYFISRPIGDYVFTFSTDEYSASIGHIYLTMPTTFSAYPEGYKIDTQQLVTYTNILTTFGYVSVSNLQNLGVYDTTLPISNRSVRLTVFVQIYKASLTVAKFEAKISPTGKNSTVNYCESQVVRYGGNNMPGKNFITVKDNPILDEVEKLGIFNIEMTMKPKTSGYFLLFGHIFARKIFELCSVDYMLQDGNITRKPSKVPTITIKKVEPQNSQPIVNYSTVVEVRVKFVDDFVYLPVVFLLQVNTSEAKIIRQKIQTIGYLLKTVAPVAYSFPVTDDSATMNITSVYANETCSDGQCDIAIRYSIIPITTNQFVITSTIICGSVNYTNTLNMTPQSKYFLEPV
ncbi:histone arginine demethylase JMJD6 [Schistosoma japonicum]|nr:histone arginine demethylase JMJD6 [Schistosoma japonicum]